MGAQTPPNSRGRRRRYFYGLHVVTIASGRITAITGFDASVMPRFGLPRTLPGTD